MSKEALVVGAGGIGSWLAMFLHNLQMHNQLEDVNFAFADDDTVDLKNVSYQNFSEEEIFDLKVEALRDRFGFGMIPEKIESLAALERYDLVVSAVDNTSFRKMIFENEPENNFYWIDLRSEGNQVSAYTQGMDREKLLQTVSVNAEGKSCQRAWELEQGIIHNGNKIIASIGSQYILNWYRGDMNKKSFNTMF